MVCQAVILLAHPKVGDRQVHQPFFRLNVEGEMVLSADRLDLFKSLDGFFVLTGEHELVCEGLEQRQAEHWSEAAAEIHTEICARALDERGVFTQHYESDALDASALLMPLVRFLPPDDERIIATVNAVAIELTEDGLVLRYRSQETDDGLSGEEGSFTICTFWLVSALCEIGEPERAKALCEKLISYASPLGLYAEEIDPRSGRHLGNFPQAFTHLALINALTHVIRSEYSSLATTRLQGSPSGVTAMRAWSQWPGRVGP